MQWSVSVTGLSLIPPELYDAAQVDGASRMRALRSIVIPYLVPVIFIVLLFRIVDTFLVIDAIYTTTFGGPGFSTNVVTLYVYWQALRYFNISFGSALSWLISILTLAVAFTLMRSQRRLQSSIWGVLVMIEGTLPPVRVIARHRHRDRPHRGARPVPVPVSQQRQD